jgi:tetratricopeptide (TPR) repeat protein
LPQGGIGVSLGAYVKALRRQKHWTQSELAKDITTKSMVSQLELGKARPSMRVIIQLLSRLEADMVTAVEQDAKTIDEWKQWATALLEEHQHDEAMRVIERLLQKNITHEDRIEWLLKFSLAALRQRKGDLVIRVLSPLEGELEEKRSSAPILTLYHYLGYAYIYQGDTMMSYHYFDRCEQGLQAAGNHPDPMIQLRTCINLGYVLMQLQRYEEAKQRFLKMDTAWNQQIPIKWKGFLYHHLAICSRRLGEREEARKYLDEASRWYLLDPEEHRDALIILNGERAKLMADQGKYEEAITFFSHSFSQRDSLADPNMKIDVSAKMAEFYYKAGRLEEALTLLDGVLEEKHRPSPSLAYAFHVRGQIYRALGRNKESVEDISRAADIYQKVKYHKDMAQALEDLDEVLHDLFDEELVSCMR